MTDEPVLVIVTSDLTWSDASLFALEFARRAQAESTGPVHVMTWTGGPLAEELAAVAPLVDLDDLNRWLLPRALNMVGLSRVGGGLKSRRLKRWLRRLGPTVMVAATVHAARLVAFCPPPGPRLVVRVDDLVDADQGLLEVGHGAMRTQDQELIGQRVSLIVAATSQRGRRGSELLGVPADRVVIGRLPLPDGAPQVRTDPPELDLPAGAALVVGLGTADSWDDPDRLPQLAWRLTRDHPDAPWHFLWCLPGEPDDRRWWPLRRDLQWAGVADRVTLRAGHPPLDVLQAATAVALTGRDVGVPLVWHEAIAADCPVVTFADGDGGDFAARGAGVAVPSLDVGAFAAALATLAADGDHRIEILEGARRTAEHDAETTADVTRLLARLDHAGPQPGGS